MADHRDVEWTQSDTEPAFCVVTFGDAGVKLAATLAPVGVMTFAAPR